MATKAKKKTKSPAAKKDKKGTRKQSKAPKKTKAGGAKKSKVKKRVAKKSVSQKSSDAGVRSRFLAFILEQHPAALTAAKKIKLSAHKTPAQLRACGQKTAQALCALLEAKKLSDIADPSPLVKPSVRVARAEKKLSLDLRGFFEREAYKAEISDEDRRSFVEGIVLTRATDNRMKKMFLTGELKYGNLGFQGKGFRSLGQEAIFAAAWKLKTGDGFLENDQWKGDVVGPLIRDLGVTLAFTDDPTMALNAQAGKSGAPLNGKDLHSGDMCKGVLPAAAPLTIASCTVVGCALAMKDDPKDARRLAVSFIGEGGSSLGEWHEAINFAAVKKLPVIFCLQNNQTALSTRVNEQSLARTFGDKALGYGIPHVTVDGSDPEDIAAAFAWAADRARKGLGATLIETVAMRLCGHAHHDDMLYLGKDPELSFEVDPNLSEGYADRKLYKTWAKREPLRAYVKRLLDDKVLTKAEFETMKSQAVKRCDEAMDDIKARDWPEAIEAGRDVYSDDNTLRHPPLSGQKMGATFEPSIEDAPDFDKSGATYLDAIARGIGDIFERDEEAFILGEDVGPPYGNAFLLLKSLVEEHGGRLQNAPIAEGAIIGACVGAALMGKRPIGEMQFNDFVASGFNQVVNNAAKMKYRTGLNVPMVMRMPYGGLRRAGPYHSQDTSPWFYRTPGLKIVAPSTPHDARALLLSAHEDSDPVLFFEHIGLYRNPKIKQVLDDKPASIPLGKAAFRTLGTDLSIIAYGAFVHRALAAAKTLSAEGHSVEVLDLRSLSPLDEDAISTTVTRTGKILLVGEDSRRGSILESIASRIMEAHFEDLDAPVRVLGALNAPVPYAPSLEDAFLISAAQVLDHARALLEW